MFFGALIFAIVWCLIALLVRRYPETMAGYNTMPKPEREKIDVDKVARLLTRSMFAGVPSVLLSPLMPSPKLYALLLCWIPCGMLIVSGIYVKVCKEI